MDETLAGREYLIGNFSAADIMLGHACFMSNRLGCVSDDMTSLKGYRRAPCLPEGDEHLTAPA